MTAQERDRLNERVRRVVDGFPPLTPEQRGRLTALLAGAGEADASSAPE